MLRGARLSCPIRPSRPHRRCADRGAAGRQASTGRLGEAARMAAGLCIALRNRRAPVERGRICRGRLGDRYRSGGIARRTSFRKPPLTQAQDRASMRYANACSSSSPANTSGPGIPPLRVSFCPQPEPTPESAPGSGPRKMRGMFRLTDKRLELVWPPFAQSYCTPRVDPDRVKVHPIQRLSCKSPTSLTVTFCRSRSAVDGFHLCVCVLK